MKQFIVTGITALMFTATAFAQKTSGASQTININLGDVIDIRFVTNNQMTGPQINMSFSTADDYYNGIESPQQTLKIRSNQQFAVTVRAVNSSATGTSTKNTVPFLYIKVPQNNTGGQLAQALGNSAYQKLSPVDIPMVANGKKGDNQTFTVQYKAKPGVITDPGVYSVDVVYTASRY